MSHTNILLLSLSVAAPALRTPLSIAGSYPTPFAMMGHHEMNGGLTSPGVYAGLHISPQMSAAAAAAYGRSPMVTSSPALLCSCIWDLLKALHIFKRIVLTFWEIHFIAESQMKRSMPFSYLPVKRSLSSFRPLVALYDKRISWNVELFLLE